MVQTLQQRKGHHTYPVTQRCGAYPSPALSGKWNYPEVADGFRLRYRNLLHCSLLEVGRAQVA